MPEQLVTIRTSERTCYKTCRQQWWWSYVEHLRPKDVRPALGFGDLVHKSLEAYYPPGKKRRGKPSKHLIRIYRKMLEDGAEEIFPIKDDPTITAEDLGVEMLDNYVAEYGDDERYEVIASEMTFQVDVFHPKTGKYLYTYVGTTDGIWRDLFTGWLVVLETKTGQNLAPFGAPTWNDEQAGSYLTFAPFWLKAKGILGPDEFVDYVLYNRLRKAFADQRPMNSEGLYLNQNGTISVRQPPPLFKREPVYRGEGDRISMLNRTLAEVREMALARQGKLKITKTPGQHCNWCDHKEMCEVHEARSDWRAIRRSLYTTWEPYEAHEIELERSH